MTEVYGIEEKGVNEQYKGHLSTLIKHDYVWYLNDISFDNRNTFNDCLNLQNDILMFKFCIILLHIKTL